MIPYLRQISEGQTLSQDDAESAMDLLLREGQAPEHVSAFLLGLRSRGETIDELVGFAKVMREHAVKVALDDPSAIDMCGTGGDHTGTFNISTAAAFVCAGAGVTVAKHGNRSISSKCGSADVLQALEVKTDLPKEGVESCLKEAGIGFMFAPLFHPALKNVMPVRRALGVRTFFNILGPLCNPAGVRRQFVGGFDGETAQTMAHILQRLDATHCTTAHGSDGLDEVTLTGPTALFTTRMGMQEIEKSTIHPEQFGFSLATSDDLRGGDANENAEIIRSILKGVGGPQRDVVILNAAFALNCSGKFDTVEACLEAASWSIDSGAARQSLEALVEASNTAMSISQ